MLQLRKGTAGSLDANAIKQMHLADPDPVRAGNLEMTKSAICFLNLPCSYGFAFSEDMLVGPFTRKIGPLQRGVLRTQNLEKNTRSCLFARHLLRVENLRSAKA